jgi:hypothetical protein
MTFVVEPGTVDGRAPARPGSRRDLRVRGELAGSIGMGQPGTVVRPVAVVLLACAIAACSASHGRAGRPTPSTRTVSTAGSAAGRCKTPTRFGLGATTNEIHGASIDATVWGLALGPGHLPPHAGEELKIVWRMTGSGPLRVVFAAPDGTARPLAFGPEPHSSSSYKRPGDEWGTGFRFDTAGCWHIHLMRADTSADVWSDVAA